MNGPNAIARWLLRTLVAGLLFAIMVAHVPLAVAADAADEYKFATGLYRKKNWKLAAEEFTTFLGKYPDHRLAETAQYYLGLSQINLEDHGAARVTLQTYLTKYPKGRDVAVARFWYGQSCYLSGKFEDSVKALKTFAAELPEHPLNEHALPFLGEAELKLGDAAAAVEHFKLAVKKFPESEAADKARFGLAQAYELQQQFDSAIALYREIAAKPENPLAADAQLSLAARLFENNDYAAAATAFGEFETRFPSSPKVPVARLRHGYALFYQNDFKAAITQFDLVIPDPQQGLEATYWKGRSQKSAGDLQAAGKVFQAAFEANSTAPMAERLLFQWADCEQRLGQFASAAKLFEEASTRFPAGALRDESLHFACASTVNISPLDDAGLTRLQQLLDRFDTEFPNSKFKLRQLVLRARMRLIAADRAGTTADAAALAAKLPVSASNKARLEAMTPDLEAAVVILKQVAETTSKDSTQTQARYFWGLALQRLQRFAEAVDVLAPVVAAVTKDRGPMEFAPALVLHGSSALSVGKNLPATAATERTRLFKTAISSASAYQQLFPQGELASTAAIVLMLSAVHLGERSAAEKAIEDLDRATGESPETQRALLEAADVAAANSDWAWSEALFERVAARNSPQSVSALLGIADARIRQSKFGAAAATYDRLLTAFPESSSADEAAFGKAAALRDAALAGDTAVTLEAVLAAFQSAFARTGDSDFVYLSGVEAARTCVKLKQLAAADTAYAAVDTRFPKHREAANLLDEWATVNYESQNYPRADEIFARIVDRFPGTDVARQAQLSLAESAFFENRLEAAEAGFKSLWDDKSATAETRQRSGFQWMRLASDRKAWDSVRKVASQYLAEFPEGTYVSDASLHLAEAEVAAGEFAAAAKRLTALREKGEPTAAESKEAFPLLWIVLAKAQLEQKQYPEVIAAVAELTSRYPNCRFVYKAEALLGDAYKRQANFAEARNAYQRVIDGESGKGTETAARCQFEIAETLLLEKKYAQAAREYHKVEILYEFKEWQAAALYQAGTCHEELKENDQANQAYRDLLTNHADSPFSAKAQQRLDVLRSRTSTGG